MSSPSISVESGGILFQDAACQAYFPSIVELSNGELLASFDLGTDMEHVDVRTYITRSGDGGRTWSEPDMIFDSSTLPYSASTLGRISPLHDGGTVALLNVCNRARAGAGLANPENEGYVETQFATLQSRDEGRAWSAPCWVTPPILWNTFEICSPIIEATQDRWLLPASLWRNWDGECPFGMKAVVFVSEDRGATWPRCVEVMDLWSQHITAWEQKHTHLSDGRWLVVCWAYDYAQRKSLPTRYTFSHDHGASYGASLEAPLAGETCTPLGLPGNHVLCIYRRVDERGLWAHLARFEGERWLPLADEPLWGARRAAYGRESASKTEQMATLQFGYPQSVRMRDGGIFVVFWCVEDGGARIRWVRLRCELP
ncbi:MAG: exo-alpha-sialidase [Candidatus Hydrogenedentes bacterium]|nr:exo-alpha-sialidase [Candidatus Hydrogenedentota bacterium]